MLALLGLPLEAAVATTMILRGFTYWLPMLPGLFIARHELKESASPTQGPESDRIS
jgi:hypothetical protein